MHHLNKTIWLSVVMTLSITACSSDGVKTSNPAPSDMKQDQGSISDMSDASDMLDLSVVDIEMGQDMAPDMKGDMMPDMRQDMALDMKSDMAVQMTAGCGEPVRSMDETFSLNHDNRTRLFDVHVPKNYDPTKPTALVLGFHGRGSNAAHQAELSGLNEVADEENFITVHPHGVGDTWNGEVCCSPATTLRVDDVGFVDAVIDEVSRRFCIDTARTYATGFSNGSILSHRLGCALDSRFCCDCARFRSSGFQLYAVQGCGGYAHSRDGGCRRALQWLFDI